MHLYLGQDGGQAFRFLGAHGVNWPQVLVKYLFVEKEVRAEGLWSSGPKTEGLVLGRGGDISLHGQVGEKGPNFGGDHLRRIPSKMPKWRKKTDSV